MISARWILPLLLLCAPPCATAGMIIESTNPRPVCWVLLIPPRNVALALRDFAGQNLVRQLSNPTLHDVAASTAKFMEWLDRNPERVSIAPGLEQGEPFRVAVSRTIREGAIRESIEGVTLSQAAAERLLAGARSGEPRTLIETGARLDPELSAEWLEAFAPAHFVLRDDGRSALDLWDVTAAAMRWRAAAMSAPEGPDTASEATIARKVWTRLAGQADPSADAATLARGLAAERLVEVLRLAPGALGRVVAGERQGPHENLSREIAFAQGLYRNVFRELGLHAALLVAARRLASNPPEGRLAAARTLERANAAFEAVYHHLSRKLEPGVLVVSGN